MCAARARPCILSGTVMTPPRPAVAAQHPRLVQRMHVVAACSDRRLVPWARVCSVPVWTLPATCVSSGLSPPVPNGVPVKLPCLWNDNPFKNPLCVRNQPVFSCLHKISPFLLSRHVPPSFPSCPELTICFLCFPENWGTSPLFPPTPSRAFAVKTVLWCEDPPLCPWEDVTVTGDLALCCRSGAAGPPQDPQAA